MNKITAFFSTYENCQHVMFFFKSGTDIYADYTDFLHSHAHNEHTAIMILMFKILGPSFENES